MDIQPASLAQVQTGRDGRRVLVDDDVAGVARKIREISPRLSLRWNERGEFFEVIEDDGRTERRVTTALECDDRLVARIMRIAHPSYDLVADMERTDLAAERAEEHAFSERTGEIAERLAHAVRKDLNPGKIIVPKGI